jgi:ankyrin repeat protein
VVFGYASAKKYYDILKQAGTPDFSQTNREGEHLLAAFVRGVSASDREQVALLLELLQDGADLYQGSLWYGEPKTAADWLAEKEASLLQAVLEAGAIDLQRRDDHGNTLLHTVCAYNVNHEESRVKEMYRKVKLLLDAGADPSATNDKDQTPVMLAEQDQLKVKIVQLLMRR